jgi:MFS family permease
MARTSWGAVVIAVLGGVLAAVHIGKLPPALPLICADLGIGLVAAGFLVSMFSVLGLSMAVLLGRLADRLGRPRLVMAGFAAMALGGALGAACGWAWRSCVRRWPGRCCHAMRGVELPFPSQRNLRGIVSGALAFRGFLVIGLTFCTYALQWVTLMVWLPTFQTESMGLPLPTAALITALVVLAMCRAA